MNKYWYNLETKHLCTDEQMTQPFLCGTEATPLTFNNSTECGEFLKENDHIVQLPSLVSIVGGVGGIKNDSGWGDNMSRIADAHPGSPFARRYGRKSTKDINTRNVLKKHGVI